MIPDPTMKKLGKWQRENGKDFIAHSETNEISNSDIDPLEFYKMVRRKVFGISRATLDSYLVGSLSFGS